MGRIIGFVLGGLFFAIGVIALIGAFELLRSGASTEAVAQGFLVPASLFVIGGFSIWMGLQAGKPRGGDD
ncbi:MAG TPA: hypothetical protein ENK63_00130 [Rhodobacterales bacterium]|nr:hypothetical protein [Rhodobacterales bacterium]